MLGKWTGRFLLKSRHVPMADMLQAEKIEKQKTREDFIMIEIFGDILNPIEETFIEARNGLQNWMIEQKCKNLRSGVDYEEDGEEEDEDGEGYSLLDVAANRMARIRAREREKADEIKGTDKPKTIAVTIGDEKIEVEKKRLKKLYKEMHPGVDKVSKEELSRFLRRICIMERENHMGK